MLDSTCSPDFIGNAECHPLSWHWHETLPPPIRSEAKATVARKFSILMCASQ